MTGESAIAILTSLFAVGDLAALGLFVALQAGISLMIETSPAGRVSVSRLMDDHRSAWMHELSRRDVRIMDAQLIASLRAGAAYFGSTCLIAIGGVAALIGQTEELVGIARDLGGHNGAAREPVWEAKLLVLLLLVVSAFLKFVWSHRLFGYVIVLVGAMPPADAERLEPAVERVVSVLRAASRHYNRGLRNIYFAIAALAWFLGPEAFALATLLTGLMLYRREFRSKSRKALMKA